VNLAGPLLVQPLSHQSRFIICRSGELFDIVDGTRYAESDCCRTQKVATILNTGSSPTVAAVPVYEPAALPQLEALNVVGPHLAQRLNHQSRLLIGINDELVGAELVTGVD
jgi:hypothetical protein